MRTLIRLVIVCLTGWDASAHEISTHEKLTQAAIAYLLTRHPDTFACAKDKLQLLEIGTSDEDNFFQPKATYFPLGRFYFHFYGPDGALNGLGQHATCTSPQWGFVPTIPCMASNTLTIPPFLRPVTLTTNNEHTWQAAVDHAADADDRGWKELGYVIHLLEDLTSPAHTRNDPHPCRAGLFCDPFEKTNGKGDVIIGMPSAGSLLGIADPSGFSTPEQFFSALQSFTQHNFFSNETTFSSAQDGPKDVRNQDSMYFYGPCLSGSDPACIGGQRKLAHKNTAPKLANDRTKSFIDSVIAREQFAELSPITVQYVAEFIRLYVKLAAVKLCSRTLTVIIGGEGDGTITVKPVGFSCTGPGQHCSTSVDDGTQVQLSVTPNSSSIFLSWSCQIAGGPPPVPFPPDNPLNITIIGADWICTANFGVKPQATVTSVNCVQTVVPLHGVEATIVATGSASSRPNILFQFGAGATSSFYNLLGHEYLELDCGVWTLSDLTTGTCVRTPTQPATTTWRVKTLTQLAPRFPPPLPPLTGVGGATAFENSVAVPLASQSIACTVQ